MAGEPKNGLAARLGRALAAQRRALGLSQAEVALRAGVSVPFVSEIERGTANPTVGLLEKLAQTLGWDPATLFSREPLPISDAVQRELVARANDINDRVNALVGRLDDLRSPVFLAHHPDSEPVKEDE
jgi:transcriptional regulator with XRE-family HTH domain